MERLCRSQNSGATASSHRNRLKIKTVVEDDDFSVVEDNDDVVDSCHNLFSESLSESSIILDSFL